MDKFELVSEFKPQGDQPQAIQTLVDGVKKGEKCQTLLGVTGSGKTFTMANVIAQVNKPTIVLAHNKTLAAQLCSEFKEFLKEKTPFLLNNGKIDLGTLHNDKLIYMNDPEMVSFIENLLTYALVRDEYRDIVEDRKAKEQLKK